MTKDKKQVKDDATQATDSYNVAFTTPDEIVTITNTNFSLNNLISASQHSISVENLQITDKNEHERIANNKA